MNIKIIKTVAWFAVLASASLSYAQLSSLPPSSATDGVMVQSSGLNAGPTHWDNPAAISAFRVDSMTDGYAPISSPAYNPIALPFSTVIPTAIQTNLNAINTTGGTVRTIFLAESAGWQDSLGYTRSGTIAGSQSFTAFAQIEMNPLSGIPVNVHNNDYFDVHLNAGTAANFDLWFRGDGTSSAAAEFTLFHPTNSGSASNVMWAQRALMVSTWIPSMGAYMDILTYIVGVEDVRLDLNSDHDYTDGIFALQFFTTSDTQPGPLPVPEPATYSFIGATALLGFIILRRIKMLKNR